ncbi:MAG: hypothetical protein DRP42_04485, partial [Tenericutes bacterium]
FDPQYAPSVAEGSLADWDAASMEAEATGWGSPDVVFMVYDPANASPDTDNAVETYEDGQAAQDAALEGAEGRGGEGSGGTGPTSVAGDSPAAARGINELIGRKPDVTDNQIRSEISRLVDTGRTSPNAALAGLRHDPMFSYDTIMNDATRRDGSDYGPEFMSANAKFTLGMRAMLAQLSDSKAPAASAFYKKMGDAQLKDHQKKLILGVERGTVELEHYDQKTKTYRTAIKPVPAQGMVGDFFDGKSSDAAYAAVFGVAGIVSPFHALAAANAAGSAYKYRDVTSERARSMSMEDRANLIGGFLSRLQDTVGEDIYAGDGMKDRGAFNTLTKVSAEVMGMDKNDLQSRILKDFIKKRKPSASIKSLMDNVKTAIEMDKWRAAEAIKAAEAKRKKDEADVKRNAEADRRRAARNAEAERMANLIGKADKERNAERDYQQKITDRINARAQDRFNSERFQMSFWEKMRDDQDARARRIHNEVVAEIKEEEAIDASEQLQKLIYPTPATSIDVRPGAANAMSGSFFKTVKEEADTEHNQFIAPPEQAESWASRANRLIRDPKNFLESGKIGKVFNAIEDQVFNVLAPLKRAEMRVLVKDEKTGKMVPRGYVGDVNQGMARMSQMLSNSSGRVEAIMRFGAPKWDAEAGIMRYATNKGLQDIFKFNGAEDYKAFQVHAYAKRAKGLAARGKGNKATQDMHALNDKTSAADKARYDAMLDDYREFNGAMLDFMKETGVLSQKQVDALKEDGDYVPMFRRFDDVEMNEFGLADLMGKNGFSHPDPKIRTMKEGDVDERFGDLMENIQKNAVAALHAGSQNAAMRQIHGFMSENLPNEVQQIKGKMKKQVEDGRMDAVMYWEDGKKKYWRPVGPEAAQLHMAVAGLRPRQLDGIDKMLKGFNDFQRTMITSTPSFAFASILRDEVQGMVQNGLLPGQIIKENITNAATGMGLASDQAKDMATQASKDMMMATGSGGYQLGGTASDRALSVLAHSGAARKTAWGQLQDGFNKYEKAIGATDINSRFAVKNREVTKGTAEGDAYYEALNYIDYNRRGASAAVQKLGFMVLFLNPRLQGLYRLGETQGKSPRSIFLGVSKSIAVRGAILMGVSLALRGLIESDDDWSEAYDNLTTQEKAGYHHIPLPGSDRFIRIPKAFEIAAAFSTLPETIFMSAMGEDKWQDTGSMAAHTFMETFSLNPTPEVIAPLAEVWMNYNMFTGRPIEGMRLQAYPKEIRSDLSTGGIAKALGNSKISPTEWQHVISSYLGPLGMFMFDAVDATLAGADIVDPKSTRAYGAFGDLPPVAKQAANFLGGRFISKTDEEKSSRYISSFYDLHTSIREYTSVINEAQRVGDIDLMMEMAQQSVKQRALKPLINKVAREMTKLNQRMRAVKASKTLTLSQKKKQIKQITFMKNQLARTAISKAQDIGLTGNFGRGFFGLSPT